MKKIRKPENGNKQAVGLKFASPDVPIALEKIYGNIRAGGGADFVAFSREVPDSTIRSYARDAGALNDMYNRYKEYTKGIVRDFGYSEHSFGLQDNALKRYEAQIDAFVKKRKK